jgi:hypothetical protein
VRQQRFDLRGQGEVGLQPRRPLGGVLDAGVDADQQQRRDALGGGERDMQGHPSAE